MFAKSFIVRTLFESLKKSVPSLSRTEREALEAGGIWWDAELFSGRPDWDKLLNLPPPTLSEEERAFIDGPTETLCAMLNDWDITAKRRDLPPEVWDFIKRNGFWGMIVPKRYGGLGFSHEAHSRVVMKIASRSLTAAVTVMVPNSLGPAKLLLAYGTQAQRDWYLPRLAQGLETPCFALTGPQAGSDASAMPDRGVVCFGRLGDDDRVLGARLNWDKRYITLGPVATVLGLAFKLYDPDRLLGGEEDIGITLALIPVDTPGVGIGRRHFPLDAAFQNGPNRGKDVFIPLDWIIGGREQAGNGWKMLMQCLATGRGLSLPALSAGAAKSVSRHTGAYARIREQFGRPIGEFEGIEEALARIAGETYIVEAARAVTAAALDAGHEPAVASAVVKHESTERMRRAINDAMDIQGGAGICLGPRNYLGRMYQTVPIGITVEGANILTRTLMIFGQGALRCHPCLQTELDALRADDPERFGHAVVRHLRLILDNLGRALWLGLTDARFLDAPGDRETRAYYRAIARLSAGFALSVDFAALALDGTLKRRERISGKFADALSNLYLCSCVLKRYQDQGCPEEDRPLLRWACRHTLYRAQQSLLGLFWKLPYRPLVWLLRAAIFPLGKPYAPPGEDDIRQTARLLLNPSPARDRLTEGIYLDRRPDDPTGKLEFAFEALLKAAPAAEKLRRALRQTGAPKMERAQTLAYALAQGMIGPEEADALEAAERARDAALAADDFAPEELTGK